MSCFKYIDGERMNLSIVPAGLCVRKSFIEEAMVTTTQPIRRIRSWPELLECQRSCVETEENLHVLQDETKITPHDQCRSLVNGARCHEADQCSEVNMIENKVDSNLCKGNGLLCHNEIQRRKEVRLFCVAPKLTTWQKGRGHYFDSDWRRCLSARLCFANHFSINPKLLSFPKKKYIGVLEACLHIQDMLEQLMSLHLDIPVTSL